MFIRKIIYPIINFLSVRHIKTHPPECYLSQKSIRNYINNGNLLAWDLYNNSNNNWIKSNIYTIEHICPKSFLKKNRNSKYDLHNLGITDSFYNVHRSNYKYSDKSPVIYSLYKLNNNKITIQINDNSNLDIKHYNYKNSALKIFIPVESSRGEIARSILYMSNLYDNNIKIKLIDEKILHKWNIDYPPSKREKERNLQIFKLQGNINPFIF